MINIYELQANIRKRKQNNKKIYNNILNRCIQKIKIAARNETTECVYQIPTMIMGLPLYDLTKCTEFVIEKLTKKGFQIMALQNSIFISWKEIPDTHLPRAKVEVVPEQNATFARKQSTKHSAQNYRDISKVVVNPQSMYQTKELTHYDNYINKILQ